MWSSKFTLLLLALTLSLTGCGLFKKKKITPPAGPQTTLVGVVEMVNPDQNYVLIRCDQVPALSAGTELIGLDSMGVESKLKLTPERKGRYLTADIISGSPQVTHLVIHRSSGLAAAPATPVPAPPSTPSIVPFPPAPVPVTLPDPAPSALPSATAPLPLEPVTTPQTPLEPSPGNGLEPSVQ